MRAEEEEGGKPRSGEEKPGVRRSTTKSELREESKQGAYVGKEIVFKELGWGRGREKERNREKNRKRKVRFRVVLHY